MGLEFSITPRQTVMLLNRLHGSEGAGAGHASIEGAHGFIWPESRLDAASASVTAFATLASHGYSLVPPGHE